MLKKIEKISLLCLLTWRYDKHSLARTSPAFTYVHGSKAVRAIEVLLYSIFKSEQARVSYNTPYVETM